MEEAKNKADHGSDLPPPQPRDPPGTRPALDLGVVARQIWAIQGWLAREREAKETKKEVV
jgi:hypothetical protein